MKLKTFIKIHGTALLLASFIAFAWMFINAYQNPSKTTLVDINSIGEANFEMFVLIPITAILGTLAFWFVMKDEVKEKKI